MLGVTVLVIKTNEAVEALLHEHDEQSQTICVLKGKILDIASGLVYKEKESLFINKSLPHSIKYFENTEVIVVYLPSLSTV